MDLGYIVGWQSDLVNTKENILPVCDKPYHTNKGIVLKGEEIGVLQNYALIWHIDQYNHTLWQMTNLFNKISFQLRDKTPSTCGKACLIS